MQDSTFFVTNDVINLGLKGIYMNMYDLKNHDSDSEFEEYKKGVLDELIYKVSDENIKDNKILQGFRDIHAKLNKSGKKYISSPENLFLYLLKYRTLPHINLLVDIYNLVSIKYSLALGAHDLQYIDGNVSLKLTTGNEKFIPLGQKEPIPIKAGDYSYIDDANEILCYLEIRQVEKTKITLNTKSAFYIIQGNPNTSDSCLQQATTELIELTKRFCGGTEEILFNF